MNDTVLAHLAQNAALKLHLGGEERKPGWTIVNAMDSDITDIVCDINDLDDFPSGCAESIYASHILEHLSYQRKTLNVTEQIFRILKPGGTFYVSVPNLQVLGAFLANPNLPLDKQQKVLRIIYGGQIHDWDFHFAGFTPDVLEALLKTAGFANVRRVDTFDLFDDTSSSKLGDHYISVNCVAVKG
ncbi:MAG: class I SAM-dependent methyltransferase [Magnetovibrionaceae bacterium]